MFAIVADDEDVWFTLKCDPVLSEIVRGQYAAITPGYHTDKRHWITIRQDEALPDAEIERLIDHAYDQVRQKLDSRQQAKAELAAAERLDAPSRLEPHRHRLRARDEVRRQPFRLAASLEVVHPRQHLDAGSRRSRCGRCAGRGSRAGRRRRRCARWACARGRACRGARTWPDRDWRRRNTSPPCRPRAIVSPPSSASCLAVRRM